MRRPIGVAAATLVLVLLLLLLLPVLALAIDSQSSFAGTYKGSGTGVSKKGKKASSGATVWVEDQGATVRFTFRFDRVPVVFAAEGPAMASKAGGTVVRISVKEAGIRGSATLALIRKGLVWTLVASGKGKALKYEGTGRLACVRTATGVELPSRVKQFEDLFSALGGGKPASSTKGLKIVTVSSGSGTGGTTAPADLQPPVLTKPVVIVKPASALAPAKAKPPVPDGDSVKTTAVLLSALAFSMIFGLVGKAPNAGPFLHVDEGGNLTDEMDFGGHDSATAPGTATPKKGD
jgi:hypothetical protein